MSADKKNTDDLINQLCGDLKATSPRCPYRRVSVWLFLSIIYLVGIIGFFGARGDISGQLTNASFLFEIVLAIGILLTASLASSWLSFPDCIQREWMKTVPVTLFVTLLIWIIAKTIEEQAMPHDPLYIGHCAENGILMEFMPLVALILLTMRGHTTQPYWSMAMNILAVCSLGWIGLRITCSMDDMGHTFFTHLLPFAAIGGFLGLFSRKLFKW